MVRTTVSRCAALSAALSLLLSLPLWAAEPPGGTAAAKPAAKPRPAARAQPAQNEIRSGELAIEKALASPTTIEFIETPLSDVIDYLKEFHGIEIQLDRKPMEEVGIAPDTPVTKSLRGIPLSSALDLTLRDLDLAYTIKHDVLLITTSDAADGDPVRKLYEVADLVVCRDKQGQLWDDYDELIEVITNTLSPTVWDAVGGPSSIAGASFPGAKVLVVSAQYRVQRQIADLLAEIRAVAKQSSSKEPPRRDAPARTASPSSPCKTGEAKPEPAKPAGR